MLFSEYSTRKGLIYLEFSYILNIFNFINIYLRYYIITLKIKQNLRGFRTKFYIVIFRFSQHTQIIKKPIVSEKTAPQ